MTIVSDTHEPVRSEDGQVGEAGTKPRGGERRIISRQEDVAIYTPKRSPRRAGTLRLIAPETPSPVRSAAAASFGSTPTEEIVIGEDDRSVVSDPLDNPWRYVCALRITSRTGQEFVGTGWFIGPGTVATAGHCVYLHDEGGWAASISVIPALNGNVEAYGRSVGKRFRATKRWTELKDTNQDYGVIQLEEPLGTQTGWFGFASFSDADLTSNVANISGYPFDRDRAMRQYFHARTISSLSPQKLFYEIDTFGGQSGSPIWFNLPNGERIAVGVHTTGSSTSNSGTRISEPVFRNLTSWAAEKKWATEEAPPPRDDRSEPRARHGAAARGAAR
jgi:glutamyl endopeptidase